MNSSSDMGDFGPLDIFARRLREAVQDAGDPSVRDLARLSRDLDNPYSRQTFSQKLNGRSKPDWGFVEALVRSCARHAGRDVSRAELAKWRLDHNRLLRELAAVRNERRGGSPGAFTEGGLALMPSGNELIRNYLALLRGRYAFLDHTNALAASHDMKAAPELSLREMFVPQQVRRMPPQTELPHEVRRQLLKYGRLRDRAPRELNVEELAKEVKASADAPPRSVLEAVAGQEAPGIVMLGNPGAGKSTLAAYLTLAAADLATDHGGDTDYSALAGLAGCLPLLIELRTYASRGDQDRDFLEEIAHPGKEGHPGLSRDALEPYLRKGGPALVIFDGLDEVFDEVQRADIKWRIRNFAAEYAGVRVIVTSRLAGYEPERRILDSAGFVHYTLQDLEPDQVAVFVRRFHAITNPGNPTRARDLTAELLETVNGSAAYAELAGNPMLLTALALLGLRGLLPPNRSEVLHHLTGILINQWDARKHLDKSRPATAVMEQIGSLKTKDKTEMLRLVARRIQQGEDGAGGLTGNYLSDEALVTALFSFYEKSTTMPLSVSEKQLYVTVSRTLVSQFRERDYILARFGPEKYGFVHRALLDYLAADDIYAQFKARELDPPDIEALFRDHSNEPEWQEVLLLLAGLFETTALFEQAVEALLHADRLWYLGSDPMPRQVLLAIRCLGEIGHPEWARGASGAIADSLISLFETISGSNDYPLAVALTQALHHDILPVLTRLGPGWAGRETYETWYLCRGQFLRGISQGFAATAAASVYVALHGRDSQARDRIRVLARWAESEMVRGAALEALARNWRYEPETAALLSQSATGDHDSYVRQIAVGALAACQPQAQATLDLLWACITRADEAPRVRATAIRWVASGWREPGIAGLLQAVGADPAVPGEVRAVAVAELAAGWRQEGATAIWLWERTSDQDPKVRAAVAHALATGWHENPDTHKWLRELVSGAGEASPRVRMTAVRDLAAGWPEEDTLTLLQETAAAQGDGGVTSDGDDAEVREAAVEAIAAGWRDRPATAQWLRERLDRELDADVRCALTESLAAYWLRDEHVAPLLERLAETDTDRYVKAIAIQALADSRGGQPRVGRWLRRLAVSEPMSVVQQTALGAAAAGWRDEQDTERLLADYAADPDKDFSVRTTAVRALTAGWPDSAATLELLRRVGVGDVRTGAVRRVALQSVAVGWPDEDTYFLLRQRAAEDPSPTVRRAALELLAANLRWHDDTARLLRDCALKDKFAEVRRAAIRILSAGWPDEPATAAWLRDEAFGRTDRGGQQTVIRSLATDWHDDPATFGWLREQAASAADAEVRLEAGNWLARGWPGLNPARQR